MRRCAASGRVAAERLARSDASSLGQIEELLGNAPAEPRGMMEADYRLPLASPPSLPRALPARL